MEVLEMRLRRYHLFELEDQAWWPRIFRDYQTDFLRDFLGLLGLYKKAVPLISQLLSLSPGLRVVDLCSGGAGPWPRLVRHFPNLSEVLLTDLYPNHAALQRACIDPRLSYHSKPVDATEVGPDLKGVRTIFTAFHHLGPKEAVNVLADAVGGRSPIAVFEIAERRKRNLLIMPLVTLAVFLLTPFIRPFCHWRLFWTYLLPVVPLSVFWDGLVSQLRAYHPHELLELAKAADPEGRFRWEAGHLPCPGTLNLTYLIGHSRENTAP